MTYACNNAPRPVAGAQYIAQAGWGETMYDGFGAPIRCPVFVAIASPFDASDCRYDLSDTDTECAGCRHRAGATASAQTTLEK